jgi:hypothetical protein
VDECTQRNDSPGFKLGFGMPCSHMLCCAQHPILEGDSYLWHFVERRFKAECVVFLLATVTLHASTLGRSCDQLFIARIHSRR